MSIKIIGAGFPRTGTTTLKKALETLGYTNLIGKSSKELDLRSQNDVDQFYKTEQPQVAPSQVQFPATQSKARR